VDAALIARSWKNWNARISWAAEEGRAQREGLRKSCEKTERAFRTMIDATRTAFLFTLVAHEPGGDRMLSKYHMVPNPAYKATSHQPPCFPKVRGYLWID